MKSGKCSKRVAVVTGGSGGIGKAVAKRLADDGMAVVIVYSGNKEAADSVVQEINGDGINAISMQADVADETAIDRLFSSVEARWGGIDVVVNSAGIMILGNIAEFDLDALDRLHRVNIRGTFVVNKEAARRVRSGGAIINLSSSVVKAAFPGYGPYAASKGAVDAISMILARELRGRDITVNAVAPGPVATELFLKDKDDAMIDRLAKSNPMERLGTPEDVAEIVSFLSGPGRWINGQVIYTNGGLV